MSECWCCGTQAAPTAELSPLLAQRCPACGFVFFDDRSVADVHELYGDRYFEVFPGVWDDDGSAARAFEASVRLRLVKRYVRSGRLLELGCATGYFLAAAAQEGFDVLGVEPGAEAAAGARERSGAEVFNGFVEDAPLPGHAFDVVCAWHVLEHIAEPVAALQRVREALAPGGRLIVEVPNIESVLARRAGTSWPHLQPQHHVGQYAPRSMRALLERSGYAVEAIETVSFFGYFRPAQRLRPVAIAAHMRESARMGAIPFRAHPCKHELLRAVARA